MAQSRKILKVSKSQATLEGAGVHLKRAFGFSQPRLFDPFLLLDDFRNENPANYVMGFPKHPHRGIETITYVLRGSVEHMDSLGNRGVIHPGDVQWMTAGSGILHQEMPAGDPSGAMHGFQLWANLPASQKMMNPRYREVLQDEIPLVKLAGGVEVRLIAGVVAGVQGPVRDIVIDPEYLDVKIPANTTFQHPTAPDHTFFAYVIQGQAIFCQESDPYEYERQGENDFDQDRNSYIDNENLVLFTEGDSIVVTTGADPVRFLLISGKPIGEPIAWYGPIVMNNQDELRIAYQELRAGTFIKYNP